jgi:deoxycytidylate deaminase
MSTGYNGFPRNMNDSFLPTERPAKYDWMLHSEFNACCNLTVAADKNTLAYVTGEPCLNCLMCLWQHGITHIVHRDAYGSLLVDNKMRKNRETFLQQTRMKIEVVQPDLSWLAVAVSPK